MTVSYGIIYNTYIDFIDSVVVLRMTVSYGIIYNTFIVIFVVDSIKNSDITPLF